MHVVFYLSVEFWIDAGKRDKNFRKYASAVERALSLFDTALQVRTSLTRSHSPSYIEEDTYDFENGSERMMFPASWSFMMLEYSTDSDTAAGMGRLHIFFGSALEGLDLRT